MFLAALKASHLGAACAWRSRAGFALGLLLLFLTLGEYIPQRPRPVREATGIAGGIILFVIAMRLIFPSPQGLLGEVPDGEPLLVPLATPAVAGPSALAMLITLRTTFDGPLWELYLAVVLAWAATALILLQAAFLQRFLGPRGLTAIERLAGMLLIMPQRRYAVGQPAQRVAHRRLTALPIFSESSCVRSFYWLSPLSLLAGCSSGPRLNTDYTSANQDSRVQFIVLHYTSTDLPHSLGILTHGGVSAHYLIGDDEPATVYRLVDENRRAWHAGVSEWQGRTWLNATSIGIEIVNQGYRDTPQGGSGIRSAKRRSRR